MIEKKDSVWDYVRALFWALLLAGIFRSFVYEPFSIPSGSMQPTLLIGDHLFVSKWTYGYSKHSLPMSPNLYDGRVPNGVPDRGDVIVFKFIEEKWRGGETTITRTDYIKRLVGLPGDTVQMKGGRLYINGAMTGRKPDGEFSAGGQTYKQYIETLPNGVEYTVLNIGSRDLDNTGIFTVPDGQYFFMGDNRDNSSDSRVPQISRGVGFVPYEDIVGRADRIMFSSAGRSLLWFWEWRSSRYFMAVE